MEGPLADWYFKDKKRASIPFALEKRGEPSKMITLRALQVLGRVDG
jgi:hypothetical protein